MGVLDDAIRQHLELKRAHGAAEEEVRQQEQEALGPARREQAEQAETPAAEATSEGGEATSADLLDAEPAPDSSATGADAEAAAGALPIEQDLPPEPEPEYVDADAEEVPADETLEPIRGDADEDVLEE